MSERLTVLSQYVLPKQALTRLAGRIASGERGDTTTSLIRWFVNKYKVDMSEAAEPDIGQYRSFNDFFTRALKPGARPLAQAELVCPVDGAISQFGPISGDQLFQAKGHRYSTTALVGGGAALAQHMPCDGTLQRMMYVPGDLFSVNPATARGVPGLFARNERLVCVFEHQGRPWVLVLVGATIVGSMATVWHGVVQRSRQGGVREWDYQGQGLRLTQGQEMGRFLLGSTVVMLFPEGPLRFNEAWQPGGAIRMGEVMAKQA